MGMGRPLAVRRCQESRDEGSGDGATSGDPRRNVVLLDSLSSLVWDSEGVGRSGMPVVSAADLTGAIYTGRRR